MNSEENPLTNSPPKDHTRPSARPVLTVGVVIGPQPAYEVDDHLDELAALVDTAGGSVVGRAVQRRDRPDAATFIGKGKVAEIRRAADTLAAKMVVFDDDLTASQVNNLEGALGLPVVDRSGLILEIFEQRARSREARTQVELARLNYELPRLARRWGHLSRQVGGIGVRGGEGESQLEADRRILRRRIARLTRDLEKIERTRKVQRGGRQHVATVALAGYTNAGKSTLFERLTRTSTKVEDRLFATLDSRLRRGTVGDWGERSVVFADTVGFIRKLPHHLVASFRSTLEEVTFADCVLHVIDRSHPRWREQVEVADAVLADLGVDPHRVLKVYNKMDRAGELAMVEDGVAVSALTGAGLDELRLRIGEYLSADRSAAQEPASSELAQFS